MIGKDIVLIIMQKKISKEDHQNLEIILKDLLENPNSDIFREPVDWQYQGLTDYPTIIKKPMDLGTIMRKLRENRYKNVRACLDEI